MSRITSVEGLRRVLPPPREATKSKILPALDEQASDFIRTSAFAIFSTVNAAGHVEASPKGDEPGFVRIENETTLLMPERAGNNLAFGLQNILETGQVGLIFLRPRTGETLRIGGRAEIFDDADLLAGLGTAQRPALLAIRIHIERCYFHCARSIFRAKLWQPESWPAEQRVLFGKIIAPRVGGDAAMAQAIDDRVANSYSTNLWSNG